MRLLQRKHDGTFSFTSNLHEAPPYAILSHTWGPAGTEVSYQDILLGTVEEKKGYEKLKFTAEEVSKAGLRYFWIDTCCINKSDDAELATAIRSMYRWYKESAVCFVYLPDVSVNKRTPDGEQAWDSFRKSRWFKRGWTLQELIAPSRVEFYSREKHIGNRNALAATIHDITEIDFDVLRGQPIENVSCASRLKWADGRETTIGEDLSYALWGLCGVMMTPRYGEGKQEARKRLEEKIIKRHGEDALDRPRNMSQQDSKRETVIDPKEASQEHIKARRRLLDQRRERLQLLEFGTIDSRRITIRKAMKQTCEWIHTQPAYLAWQDTTAAGQLSGFFWIRGKPGAGKSVLVKYLQNHVSDALAEKDICISFYFNARGDELEKSLIGMYRSLLLQLMRAAPYLQAVLDDARALQGSTDNTIRELQRLLANAVLQLDQRRLFCFIDALDECREQDVQQMVDQFQELGLEACESNIVFKTCFASRHYPSLDIPTDIQLILEDVEEHSADLQLYVQSQSFRAGPSNQPHSIPGDIQATILAKANGVFLFAVLVVEILKKEYMRGRIHAVSQRLEQIPRDLSDLFKDIVNRDKEHVDEFVLCLKWILHAEHALRLHEFYFAMMAGIEGQSLRDDGSVSRDIMHNFLLNSSKGLAELTKGQDSVVQFIHESVRDFLVTQKGFALIQEENSKTAAQDHEMLKQCCLRALRWRETQSSEQDGLNQLSHTQAPYETHPFLWYASTCVLYHADLAATDVDQAPFIRDFDLRYLCAPIMTTRAAHRSSFWVYICADKGYANLIRSLARLGHDMKQSGEAYITPLFAALASKRQAVAQFLLELDGANEPERIYQEAANANWGLTFTEELSFTKASMRGDEPWLWAVQHRCERLGIHLITSTYHDDALQEAARSGSIRMIELLLAKGIDVNISGGYYGNALQAAACSGSPEVVALLLSHGADVHAQGGQFHNALLGAMYTGSEQVITLLLQHGADVHDSGGNDGDALQIAACHCSRDTVKMLLDYNADVHAIGGYYGTALQAAASHGSKEIVQLLLDHGADVNACGGHYGSALKAAISNGHQRVIDQLLAGGAIDHRDIAVKAESVTQPVYIDLTLEPD